MLCETLSYRILRSSLFVLHFHLVLIASKLLVAAWYWQYIDVLAWSYACTLDLGGVQTLVVEEELTAFAHKLLAIFLVNLVLDVV